MSDKPVKELYVADALLPGGWARNVRVAIDAAGNISAVEAEVPVHKAPPKTAASLTNAIAIPGMPNMHSHAFQRAMAGLAEMRAGDDDFWSWRLVMYDFVERLTPEILEAVAAQLYVEMLKAGYTSVGEFHYLHHDKGGNQHDDIAEMSRAILRASHEAGIGLTLLPTLYMTAGFASDQGSGTLQGGQQRFYNNLESYGRLMEALQPAFTEDPDRQLGIAFHSLRAVPGRAMEELLKGLGYELPVHIHIAEQRREVVECVQHLGTRPVEWLLDNMPVDARWCLVHATHTTEAERYSLKRSGAVVCLCPTTEANLGDGLFPTVDWLDAGGIIAIGSDSNVSVDPREELRLLEYAQRLARERRTLLAAPDEPRTGARLYRAALAGGAQASGRAVGEIAVGKRADIVLLDAGSATLTGREGDLMLDSLVFTGGPSPVRDVMVGGKWCIRDGRHGAEDTILANYRAAVGKLMGAGDE